MQMQSFNVFTIFSDSWQLYRKSLTKSLPLTLLEALLVTLIVPILFTAMSPQSISNHKGVIMIITALLMLLRACYHYGVINLINQYVMDSIGSYKMAFQMPVKKYLIVAITSAICFIPALIISTDILGFMAIIYAGKYSGLILSISILVLLIALYPLILLYFGLFNALINGDSIITAIKNSYAMVRGKWWKTFFILALKTIVYVAIIFIVPRLMMHLHLNVYVETAFAILLSGFLAPWMFSFDLTLFHNLKKQ